MKRLLLCLPVLFLAQVAAAQVPPAPPETAGTNVEMDPIRCWWRTSAGFVRLGETFELALTCAVIETESVQVVPDESRLGAAVIQMAPFEVVDGRHPADLRSGSRRFFQYQYTLRVISPDVIGTDVPLPQMAIHYTINSQVAARTSTEGRDLAYILPEQAMHVASMVPVGTADIRDAAGEDFASVEALGFKSSVLEIAAMTAFGLGGLLVASVLVRYARRAIRRTPSDERLLPTRGIASAAVRELAAVGSDRDQHGWSDALAGRALTATRLAAACALGRPATQRLADGSASPEGRLVVPGFLRRKPRALFSPMTAVDLTKALQRDDGDRTQILEPLRDAMAAFSGAQYGRSAAVDASSLDSALAGATAAANRVKSEHSWLRTFIRQWKPAGATAAA